jgi:uncharacterized protein (TIGR02453 family)
MLQANTVQFLKNLKKHNNKEWFEKNRKVYEAAREDFNQFIQAVIDAHGKYDPSINHLHAQECMFRINRDVRFSKNKDPYKTNMGASINKGGRKSMSTAGYYFHCQPGHSFAGGGIWMPEAADLKKVRQEIDYNFPELQKILKAASFRKVYGDLSHEAEFKLSRPPKGYEADNPAIDYLKLKSYIAERKVTDQELLSRDLVKNTVAAFRALQPLIEFINQSIAEN